MPRRYGLIVHGAAGFTGRQALPYMASRAAELKLPWAIAGRNGGKLASLAASLPAPRPAIVVADATDDKALRELAADATAVVSFLGPHAPLGDVLVAECVSAGTHYADLCGENDVIAQRLVRFDSRARQAKIKLIPACGYESVPFDLLALGLHDEFRRADGSRLQRVVAEASFVFHRNPLRFGHGNSGGTLATLRRLVEDDELTDTFRFARAASALPPTEHAPELQLRVRRSADGDWMAPLMPTPFLNPAVIYLTSARLRDGQGGYAPGFTYEETLNMSASFGSALLALPAAKGSAALLRRIAAMSKGRRSLGDRVALAALTALSPESGDGPSPATLDAIDYRIRARGYSSSGLTADAAVNAAGHPGYRSAAKILAEVGIALAGGRSIPGRSGVLTPASAFELDLTDALAGGGVRFEFHAPRKSTEDEV
ncbi:MAG TPA: saccharopine dehydrogenase NADP-binding domain-containing protein [Solirubrobacterales bacterium]|nr:saccharopine dehydrogenase NADP-binding domain-containing protein [Solirubrobacterales bacterium]